MASSAHAASAGPGQDTPSWLKVYMFDVVTLCLTSALALKFWWTYLAFHDVLFLWVAVAGSLAETTRRIIVARRHWQRPATFFADRRSDLLAGLLIGTGPWPVLPALGPLVLQSFVVPVWFRLLAMSGLLALCAERLVAVIDCSAHRERMTPIRQLTAVPDLHTASVMLLPKAVASPWSPVPSH